MTQPAPQLTFDARPLSEPVDQHAVKAFAAELRARGAASNSVGAVVGIVIAGIAILVTVPMMITVFMMLASNDSSPVFGVMPLVLFGAVFAAGGVAVWLGVRNARVRRFRLHRFAQANGMHYEGSVADPPLPGMIFNLGRARSASDLLRGTRPRFVEFGNYRYTTGSGKNSTTHKWGYVAVKLDVPLPNIVLDAKGNNSFGSNLPASFEREQHLSLEGNFDQYFTLYCPAGYERDALYLFTPDIMARFIDNAAELDVEIVDDWMFLYTRREVSTLDPATWAWLFGVVGALITKFDQWARWRDERLLLENPGIAPASAAVSPAAGGPLPFAPPVGLLAPPPGVAQQGRRLKRRFQWLPIVFIIVFAVFWLWTRML
ncbi:hypothetical protein [Microbacterium sp. SD291]|uniref:hypothetical protein n=1 Tax=Microbacterium sp. SD291 TaxID=2782007 RepID=UPI001A97BDDA|nr:hypothetical protein [Microbacterium sp. SD291]MBO0980277.1 hypothetical protein [Microbacterium sp. SD291]